MDIHTIGFTQRSAAAFFGALKKAGIKRLIDVRLNNTSQLSAFTKKDDLAFFLKEICAAEYIHEPLLAPTQEMLDAIKKEGVSWTDYERIFLKLMADRAVEKKLDRSLFSPHTVLLCSELKPEHCHRSLIVKYLGTKWGDVNPLHL